MKSHESAQPPSNHPARLDENEALRRVVEGTASETGERFFRSLVDNLRSALGTMGAWVATIDDDRTALCAVSMRMKDDWLDGFSYPLVGTPCELALSERRPCINAFICDRASGPRKYDIAQRDSKRSKPSSCTLCSRNTRLPRLASVCSIAARSNFAP